LSAIYAPNVFLVVFKEELPNPVALFKIVVDLPFFLFATDISASDINVDVASVAVACDTSAVVGATIPLFVTIPDDATCFVASVLVERIGLSLPPLSLSGGVV
jgi:hypothetical protein